MAGPGLEARNNGLLDQWGADVLHENDGDCPDDPL